jgi:hypothetical protein
LLEGAGFDFASRIDPQNLNPKKNYRHPERSEGPQK